MQRSLPLLFCLSVGVFAFGCASSPDRPQGTRDAGPPRDATEPGDAADAGLTDTIPPDAMDGSALDADTPDGSDPLDAGPQDTGPVDTGPASCGNGVCEGSAEEQSCPEDCYCGNGTIESGLGEVCDDGNTADGDGCSSTCRPEFAQCGDGVVNTFVNETCDDGNKIDGDGCDRRCLDEISPSRTPALFTPVPPSGSAPVSRVVTLDPTQTSQRIRDWSFADGLPWETPADFTRLTGLMPQVIQRTVDAGINRIRLEMRSGFENDDDYFDQYICSLGNPPHVNCNTVQGRIDGEAFGAVRYRNLNDNGNPNQADLSRFHFGELDFKVELLINPLREAWRSAGSKLYVNLAFVDFIAQTNSDFQYFDRPDEYAEVVVETFRHLQTKYGWVPDGFQIMVEPDGTFWWDPVAGDFRTGCNYDWRPEECGDNVNQPQTNKNWDPADLADVLVAAGDRLAAAGFRPDFIGPSTTLMHDVTPYVRAMVRHNPRVTQYLSEISYHRYGRSRAAEQLLRDDILPMRDFFNAQGGMQADLSMLEWWVSPDVNRYPGVYDDATGAYYNYVDLHQDLREGDNSSWQVGGAIVWTTEAARGANLGLIAPSGNIIDVENAFMTGQYTRNIRRGAVRIRATSNQGQDDPLAFVNRDGRRVVIVKGEYGSEVAIAGLPAGRYVIDYGARDGRRVSLPAQTISNGDYVVVRNIPGNAVLAVVGPQ